MVDSNSETGSAAGAGTSKRTGLIKKALAAGVLVVCVAAWLFVHNSDDPPSVTTPSSQRVPVPIDTSNGSEPNPAAQDTTSNSATSADEAVSASVARTKEADETATGNATRADQTDETASASVARTKEADETATGSTTRA
ncbi:MAG: hypothetical protein CFH37_00301, partial [Alphaproteobacteria bacterium MarineAlpha9_Bin7]